MEKTQNMLVTTRDIVNRFGFHPADTEEKRKNHASVRGSFINIALLMNALLPDGRNKSVCLTHLEEACRAANAALALSHGDPVLDELDDTLLRMLYYSVNQTDVPEGMDRSEVLSTVKAALGFK